MAEWHIPERHFSPFDSSAGLQNVADAQPGALSGRDRIGSTEGLAEIYPILVHWGLHRDALTAWLPFQNALELRQTDGLFTALRQLSTWAHPERN